MTKFEENPYSKDSGEDLTIDLEQPNLPIVFHLNDYVNTTVTSFSITYTVNTTNAFNRTSTVLTSHGIQGCSRSIVKSSPESLLYGFSSNLVIQSCIDSWIETSSSILFTIAYVLSDSQIREPYYNYQVVSFIDTIENHLFSHHQKFLVGEFVTAADVVVAILLHDAIERLILKELPEQTRRWLLCICLNDFVSKVIDQKKTIENIGIGKVSPRYMELSTIQIVLKEVSTRTDTLQSKHGFNSK
jgi:hypothetical protein